MYKNDNSGGIEGKLFFFFSKRPFLVSLESGKILIAFLILIRFSQNFHQNVGFYGLR